MKSVRAHGPARRLMRRAARRLLPPAALVAPGVRHVLGLHCEGRNPVEFIDGIAVEYSFRSVIGQLLYLHGEFEAPESDLITARLAAADGGVFLDIGANIGLHSLRAARMPQVAQVFAFEPAQATFGILHRNICRNRLQSRITAQPVAVSANAGRAEFHYCDDDAYSSLTPDHRRPVSSTYAVEVVTVDAWCAAQAVQRVDLIKVDVEGAEPQVIAGAVRTLRDLRPELVVEVYQGDRVNYSAEALIEGICALGYDAFVLVGRERRPYQSHDDNYFNYHFVPSSAVKR